MSLIFNNLDSSLLLLIHQSIQNPIFDRIMPYITYMGNYGVVWIIISIILLTRKEYRRVGFMCIFALVFSTIVGEVLLKHLIQRPRPFIAMPTIHLLISKPLDYSFPSGHTTSSFAVAGIIYSELKKYRMYTFILAALIAFSRIYLLVHYPSDVLSGIMVGLICAKIILLCFKWNLIHTT